MGRKLFLNVFIQGVIVCRPYGCQKVVLTSGENGYGIPELQAVLNAAVAAEDQEAE